MDAEVFAFCLRELLEATAYVTPADYRAWALERIAAVVPMDAARWLSAPEASLAADDGCVVVAEPGSGHACAVAVCFERHAPAAFTDDERRDLTLLGAQALAASRFTSTLALLRHLVPAERAAALLDGSGGIHAVHGAIFSALRASWPAWNGGALPPVLQHPPNDGAVVVAGSQRWSVEAAGGWRIVTARPVGAVIRLTPREQAVAAALLRSGSQAEAAALLGVSRNTVRNTLVRVYRKLGIRNRMELAVRLRPELISRTSPRAATRVRPATAASPSARNGR